MKVLVFGASGKTGRLVVQRCIEKNWEVSAFLRSPEKLKLSSSKLRIITGDVLDKSDVAAAVTGQDAVVCCIGAPAGKAGTLRSSGTANIIEAMADAKVDRFICQTSLGYDDSQKVLKKTPFAFRYIFEPLLLRKTFQDHAVQEEIIKRSQLNWTIVRPGILTDGPLTQNYRTDFEYSDPNLKVQISRADVADLIVEKLLEKRKGREVTGISY